MQLKSNWPITAVNFFYYGVIGCFISYLAIILSDKGFSSLEIGQVFALFTITRVFTGHIWSHWADSLQKTDLFFKLGAGIGAVCLSPILYAEDKSLIFGSVIVGSVAFLSVISQIEVMTLRAANNDPKTYNRLRMFGSIGFIVMATIAGILIEHFGSNSAIIATFIALLLILVFSQFHVSKEVKVVEEQADGFWRYCLNMPFVTFILASILLQMSFAPYVGFFTQYIAQAGYQGSYVGLIYSLGTLSEIVIFIFAGSILAKFNLKLLFVTCLLLTALRWFLQGYFVDVPLILILTQCIHALSFGLMHSSSIHFIKHKFPQNQQNRAQFMYLGVTFGIGGSIGAWLTGVTWQEGAGSLYTLQWAGVAAFIGALIILTVPKKKFQLIDKF